MQGITDNTRKGKPHLTERKCPICKRRFIIRGEWGWTLGQTRYCRYSCMREAEKRKAGQTDEGKAGQAARPGKQAAQKETRRARARTLDELRAEMVRAHAKPTEIQSARLWNL